jgi:hypothetical protein
MTGLWCGHMEKQERFAMGKSPLFLPYYLKRAVSSRSASEGSYSPCTEPIKCQSQVAARDLIHPALNNLVSNPAVLIKKAKDMGIKYCLIRSIFFVIAFFSSAAFFLIF